jgi:type I restriction enzyme R subunit
LSQLGKKTKVVTSGESLKGSMRIHLVRAQEKTIYKITSDEFWQEVDIFELEQVRVALRDLLKLIPKEDVRNFYTPFEDEVLSVREYETEFSVNDLKNYKQKVEEYLRTHNDDMVVHKLRNNLDLSHDDIEHLEKILWGELGTKEEYKKEYESTPLLELASTIVGMDSNSAKKHFSEFLSDESLNTNQMQFVHLIVNYVIKNGIVDKTKLARQPFSNLGQVSTLFKDKMDVVKKLMTKIDQLNDRVKVS